MFKPVCLLVLMTISECTSFAQNTPQSDFKKLSLEELLEVNVTSVSRKAEPLAQAAAAVTVITAEDIRRSGVTSIAEALRLAPGMQVSRINASTWAISARGFSSALSDKMLVLIDGRTAYSPIFAGVFWEIQDMVLDDIDRIEVVRGPGATLWGTNAVNGIVNIITKTAYQTQSTTMVVTGGGADNLGLAWFRQGGAISADTNYRVYGKYSYRDQLVLPNGSTPAQDSSKFGSAGFRIDSSKGPNELTLQLDTYRGFEGVFIRPDSKLLGGDLAGRWNRRISNSSSIQLQASYERLLRRVMPQSDIHQRILDFDLQHQLAVGKHNITWGGGYRWNDDSTFPMRIVRMNPASRTYPLETAFIQDEIRFYQNRVRLQVGSKFEHNAFTGFEIQPSVRASLEIRPDKFVWGAVSRAVRTPTRFDTDVIAALGAMTLIGNKDFRSEGLVAFEAGYRSRIGSRISADVATFFSNYGQLRTVEPIAPIPPRAVFFNNLNGTTYGVELSGSYDALESLRFTGAYSYLGKELRMEPGHIDLAGNSSEGNDAKHQFFIRASSDLPYRFEWDSTVRYVGRRPLPPVPAYFEFDGRLGWNATARVELSVIGRNLLHEHRLEFIQTQTAIEHVQRDVYGRIAVRF